MDIVITLTYRFAAKFYDLFGEKTDLEFYKELALQSGKNALELGVGTARVAIPLAKAGIRVVGIDNSDFMLEEARRKLVKEPILVRKNVILKKGDIRNFDLHQFFSFIYIPASTLRARCGLLGILRKSDRATWLIHVFRWVELRGV